MSDEYTKVREVFVTHASSHVLTQRFSRSGLPAPATAEPTQPTAITTMLCILAQLSDGTKEKNCQIFPDDEPD
jgi:hypothetical protein